MPYILYKHPSIILSFKETNRPAPMASVALKSDKSATSFPIVATRPTRGVVQQISSLTSAPRCFRCFQTHFSLYFVYICLYFVFKRGTPPECPPLANSSPPITSGVLERATGLSIHRTNSNTPWNCVLPIPVMERSTQTFQEWVVAGQAAGEVLRL